MLTELTVEESQLVAEALVQYLIDNANTLDPAAISEVIQAGVQSEDIFDIIGALLGLNEKDMNDWLREILEEQDWEPEL